MDDPSSNTADAPTPTQQRSAPRDVAGRLARLTLKELREILRDSRTIVTLVVMPLLVYPLLSIGFRQFFLTQMAPPEETSIKVGFASREEGRWFEFFLREYGQRDEPPLDEQVTTEFILIERLEDAVRTGLIDLGVRLKDVPSSHDFGRQDLAIDGVFLLANEDPLGEKTLRIIERRLAAANAAFLTERLEKLEVSQRAVPVRATPTRLSSDRPRGGVSLLTVLPLILIMMTITGAVYPAIDLTAGERERGTLEILVAAPVPRLGLLLAKYVSVLTVALLTATVNLVTMGVTIALSGMAPMLFGEDGWTAWVPLQVLGLLVLFAAFFSAVLLTLTSFARSFKEAQAYLIPLMLLSLAPGVMSLMPGLKLEGLLAVMPLVNIVLLGRELLEQTADFGTALIVVLSTFVYAAAAVALAARVFGSEDVLFNAHSGWSDVFRRPRDPRPAPSVASALLCLALVFPAYFVLSNGIAQMQALAVTSRMLLAASATALLFGGFPRVAAWLGHDPPRGAFNLRRPPWLAVPAAIVLGLSLWLWAHEVVVWQRDLGIGSFGNAQFARVKDLLEQWRQLPLVAILLAMAVTPGVFEELFFRGYLFRAFEAHAGGRSAILGSALLFGAFHLVATDSLAVERFLPSTLLGLVLGWVCWRTKSVWPGILLHVCHNGLLLTVSYYEPWLTAQGWGVAEVAHLPAAWLAASAAAVSLGVAAIWAATRSGVKWSL